MRIIISPAKKMNEDTDSLEWRDLPAFLPQAEQICAKMQKRSPQELKKLWKCSDKIAEENIERLRHMDLRSRLTPAVLSYEGLQYQYMAPCVFSRRECSYIQERLRILSGFYGILRPFDGVRPYRLEMQARLTVGSAKDLYEFWGSSLADFLIKETDCILNLASKEYSKCIERYLPSGVSFITCVFGEERNGRMIEKGTLCKMARGEMVRRMAENQIKRPEDVKSLSILDYVYSPGRSDEKNYVFLRKESGAKAGGRQEKKPSAQEDKKQKPMQAAKN